jgi:hypothetical protein
LGDYQLVPSPALESAVKLSVPGFVKRGNPGEPARLSRKFLVGLPPDSDYTLTFRVLSSERLGKQRLEPMPYRETQRGGELGIVASERYQIDPAAYGAYRSPATVTADEVVYIRRQRVLPVWVEPVIYDPSAGETTLATSIEVEINFRQRRSDLPDGRLGDGRPTESPAWEKLFSRLLVNAGQAAKWRPAPRLRQRAPERLQAFVQADTLIKLKVRKTGIHKVSAATVIAAGFPANQQLDNLHLFVRGYDESTLQGTASDIRYTVSEDPTSTQGVFDGQDLLIFYGLRLRDDPSKEDTVEQFSDHNIYWLGNSSGPNMADRVLTQGFLSTDTLTASFPVSSHFEIDRAFREGSPKSVTDYYYYNEGTYAGHIETEIDFPFEVNTVKPGATLQLEAQLLGQIRYPEIHIVEILLVNRLGTMVLHPGFGIANKDIVAFQTDIPAAALDTGENTFRMKASAIRILLNWIRVSYESLYRAHGNTLRFNTASLSGDTSLTVTGLSDDDVRLFDVTDPSSPVNCVLDPGLFTYVGDSYALTFRDAIAASKDYILIPEARMIEIDAGDVVLDAPGGIIGSPAEMGVDVLVVSPRDFVNGMGEWLRYRRAQGYRVLFVDLEDVFDEFNGGVPGTLGVDRFIRHFFELGNAGFVLLVGDGNEDSKGVHADSPPNFVPSHARAENVGSPFHLDEVVTVDKVYVKLPGPGGTVDAYPDLAIGRLPVGNTTELQIVMAKIFKYEKPQASDFWRRRMIFIADDAYSSGSVTGYIEHKSWEEYFRWGQDDAEEVVEGAFPQGGYDVIRFDLADYTDEFHPNQQDAELYRTQLFTRANATPAIMDELKKGATLVSIQAHMNRHQICHENLLVTEGGTVNPPNRDHLRIDNRDKPFIIFGFGCHFTDYALYREMASRIIYLNNPNGDSFAEQLLLQNNEGAVATYGSSGFEYLDQTNIFNTKMTQVWFYDTPYDTLVQQKRVQWVLGELMYLTEIAAIDSNSVEIQPVERYHLLGDPLLRIDAGPPRFDVTVDGETVQTGDAVKSRIGGEKIEVSAIVRDENAIAPDAFELWIDGVEKTQDLTVSRIIDESLPAARGYELNFDHQVAASTYDIVLKAFQAPDTSSGQFHIAAEFVLKVISDVLLYANGRPVNSGEAVPANAGYRVELSLPVVVQASEIGVAVDEEPVVDLTMSTPVPGDSTTWVLAFSASLGPGKHSIVVSAAENEFAFEVTVSLDFGLDRLVNYPNPFSDGTYFVYTNDVEISEGTIDVYTTSGKKVVQLRIPPGARGPGENAVYWDGRDAAGDDVANGVYLYLVKVKQRGESSTAKGKLARIR